MRIPILILLLASPAVAQTAPRIIRPPPDVYMRDRTPEAVTQDEARAAMLACTKRATADPSALESAECVAAKTRWDAEVKRNEALQAGHK
jgi:hypothetical protein